MITALGRVRGMDTQNRLWWFLGIVISTLYLHSSSNSIPKDSFKVSERYLIMVLTLEPVKAMAICGCSLDRTDNKWLFGLTGKA